MTTYWPWIYLYIERRRRSTACHWEGDKFVATRLHHFSPYSSVVSSLIIIAPKPSAIFWPNASVWILIARQWNWLYHWATSPYARYIIIYVTCRLSLVIKRMTSSNFFDLVEIYRAQCTERRCWQLYGQVPRIILLHPRSESPWKKTLPPRTLEAIAAHLAYTKNDSSQKVWICTIKLKLSHISKRVNV